MAVAALGRSVYLIAASLSSGVESCSSGKSGLFRCNVCTSSPASPFLRCHAQTNGASFSVNSESSGNLPGLNASNQVDKTKGKLESLFYCDSGIPEEKIEMPTGLPKGLRAIGNKPVCPECEAKGAVQCATCSGSGLYVDSVLESQGIIVKVRCLGHARSLRCLWNPGCGGSGNHMCLGCGGRGHV